MKAKIITLILCLATISAMGQVPIKRQKPTPTPQPVKPKPTPKPKVVTPKPEPEAAGYDFTFYCNVPTAELYIDTVPSGLASGTRFLKTGYHPLKVTAEGYQDHTKGIYVDKYHKSERIELKKIDAEFMKSKGDKFYNNRDYTQAIECYKKAAEFEDVDAYMLYHLGNMYSNGEGVKRNYEEAVKWYGKSAEKGYRSGQYALGNAYRFGNGARQDYYEAVTWYRKAADQGHDDACCKLGECYEYGYSVTKDMNEAVKWYKKAAENGYVIGMTKLAYCYRNIKEVQDINEAIRWYREAAKKGDKWSKEKLKELGAEE